MSAAGLSAADELAVRNIVARLAHLADDGDVDAYIAEMTDDVVWSMPANPAAGLPATSRRGHDEIAAGARERIAAGLQGPGTSTRHIITTAVIDFESDDRARARSTFLFVESTTASPTIRTMGQYDDVMQRTPDGWKLAARTITFG
jgi:3-phenylpropionate/cinnamic acid dioxygenase small subunit